MKRAHGIFAFKKLLRRWKKWRHQLGIITPMYIDEACIFSAEAGKTEELLSLLKRKEPDVSNELRLRNCLYEAARGGHVETVRALLDLGAESHKILLCAAQEGHTGVVQLLLQHGADIEEKDEQGRTALLAAVGIPCYPLKHNRGSGKPELPEIAEITDWQSPLWDEWEERRSHSTTVCVLVTYGADMNISTMYGHTALMGAAYHGDLKSLRLLLDAGADVDARDLTDLTALSYAAAQEQKKAIQLLHEYGARV